ncbi:hypothetical protein BS78_03G011200 [Paspalum vaginatum]|nr:hypothetical protein BS78_03G011200 [Paspalum vaginatum]
MSMEWSRCHFIFQKHLGREHGEGSEEMKSGGSCSELLQGNGGVKELHVGFRVWCIQESG